MGLVAALVALSFTFDAGLTQADAKASREKAAHAKPHAKSTHAKHQARAAKKSSKKIAVTRKKGPAPSLTIVSKTPNDAPDFDFQKRIEEAQALVEKQPVLKDDIQTDASGKLTHF